MANHKSAIKRNRQNIKIRERNRDARAAVRAAIKKARVAIESGDKNSKELLRSAEKAMAKATNKGLYHKKTTGRKLSRLHKQLSAAKK